MDFAEIFRPMLDSMGGFLPNLLGAVAILFVGWLVALVTRAAIRKALGFVQLNRRVLGTMGRPMDLERGAASIVYYAVMVLALLAFFNALQMEIVSAPLQSLMNEVLAFLPRLVGAAVLLLVAWIVATALRSVARKALAATSLDAKLGGSSSELSVSANLSNVLYALVILLFLPAVLGTLEMQGLLTPVEAMAGELLAALPNIFAAAVIGLVGWFVARIVRDLVTNLLAAAGADRVGARVGMGEGFKLSRLVGMIVYVLTLVPSMIAALNALQIEAIVGPATNMLNAVLEAVPHVFAAALILTITWFVARLAGELVTKLLAGSGLDALPARMDLGNAAGQDAGLSRLIGRLVIFFAMLFASVAAANRLGFSQVAEMVALFTRFGGQILLGSVIIAVGFALATLARRGILRVSGAAAVGVANTVRFAILGMVFAMGLRAMGVADDIVNLAFGLTLGSMAVAFALSFGLGGREAAGRLADSWVSRLKVPRAAE